MSPHLNLDNKDLPPEKLYRFALKVAHNLGMGQESEDVAQLVVLNRLQGLGKKQTTHQSVIDAIDSLGFGSRQNRSLGKHHRTFLDETIMKRADRSVEELGLKPHELARMADFLRGRDRAIFLLYYKWGFYLGEIGDLLGVSESRVNQKLTVIVAEIKALMCQSAIEPT